MSCFSKLASLAGLGTEASGTGDQQSDILNSYPKHKTLNANSTTNNMNQQIHRIKSGTTTIEIRADWSQASCPIAVKYSDCNAESEWETSGNQVADFSHSPKNALQWFKEISS